MFRKTSLSLLGRITPQTIIFKRLVSKNLTTVVSKEDVEKTLDFINLNFFRDEPIVRVMGIDDTCDLQRYFKREISSGWTIKLVDENSDIMGLALCIVNTPGGSKETRTFAECSIFDPKTKRLLNLWADIEDSKNLFECFKVREVWDIHIMATAAGARGLGVSKLLVNEARKLGKQEGLRIVRSDCTSFFSAQLARSVKFITLPPRHVLTFRDKKGCPWLPEAPPHPHGHVVVAYDFLI